MERNRKAERRRLVATMRAQHRSIDDIATEIARRERCSPMAAYRMLHELSQEAAAEQYNQALGVHIGDPGYMSRHRIGKLESWPHSAVVPTLSELTQLAHMYGTEPYRLIPPDHISRLPASVRAALQRKPDHVSTGRTLGSPTTPMEVDDMNRRELLNVMAAAGIGASLPLDSLEKLRGALTRAVGVSDALADWQTVADHYAAAVPSTSPKQILADLLVDLAELSRLLNENHPERNGLLAVSAQLSAYAAMALYDSGYPRAAFRWWDAARKTADAAGNVPLQAWIRAREGADLLHGPKLSAPALKLADQAVKISESTPCAGLAEARALRATALARQGNPAARAALDDLSRTFDRLPDDVTQNGQSWAGFGERRLRSTEAGVHLLLRNAPAARRAAERALVLDADIPAAAAWTSMDMATCMVLEGDADGGLDYAVTALTRTSEPTMSVREKAGWVLQALPEKARGLPAADELRELTHA